MSHDAVTGREVRIEFDGTRCIHSRHCVLGHPDVFVPNAPGGWIHPDAASAEEVMHVVQQCPSGALVAVRRDGGPQEQAPKVNTVRVLENGPLAVRAALTVRGAPSGFRATLCRCGQSANKPFCDGAHAKAGFTATGEPATQDSAALDKRDGPLDLRPVPNGPLHVVGAMEIISGTGRTVQRGTEAWLCRCGQSKNKPFCDGSHKAAGFIAA